MYTRVNQIVDELKRYDIPSRSAFVSFALHKPSLANPEQERLVLDLMHAITAHVSSDHRASIVGEHIAGKPSPLQIPIEELREMKKLPAATPTIDLWETLFSQMSGDANDDMNDAHPHLVVVFSYEPTARFLGPSVVRSIQTLQRPVYFAFVGMGGFSGQKSELESLRAYVNNRGNCAATSSFITMTAGLYPGFVFSMFTRYNSWVKQSVDNTDSEQDRHRDTSEAEHEATDTFEAVLDPLVDAIQGVQAALSKAGEDIASELTVAGRRLGAVAKAEATLLVQRWRNRPR